MRPASLPPIDLRYWCVLALASVSGANMGDFVSHVLHLGHWRGLPVPAALFALVLRAERRAASRAWYWAAILLVRTAATNLADLATHDMRLPVGWVAAGLEALMVLLCLPAPRPGARLPPSRPGARLPGADGWYWATMLAAGTLGTALGDVVAEGLGLGTGPGTLALGAVLLLVLLGGAPSGWAGAAYWIVVVAVRSAGTTAGDFLVDRVGLGLATSASGVAFAGLAWAWRGAPPLDPAGEGSAFPRPHPPRAVSPPRPIPAIPKGDRRNLGATPPLDP